jgi:hypothetical protein
MVLIKGVIPAVKPDQTIGIVDPARAGGEVVARIPAQVQRLAFGLQFLFSPGMEYVIFITLLIQIAEGCGISGSEEDLLERNKKMEIKVVQNTSSPIIR